MSTANPAPFGGTRATVFAVLTVLLGAAAHRAGHGAPPALPDVVAAFVLSVLAARPLARRQRGVPGLTVGVLGSQLGLHVAFLGHHHTAGEPLLPGPVMTAAHGLAAVALVLWLRSGERALGALARGVTARLLPTRPPSLPVRRVRPAPPARPALRRPRSLVLAPTARRGPPPRAALSALA